MSIPRSRLNQVDFTDIATGRRLDAVHPGSILLSEFIEPLGPSVYQEHLDRHGEGPHHFGFDAVRVPDFIETYRELGIAPAMDGTLNTDGEISLFAYFDTFDELGVLTEIVEFSPALRQRMQSVAEAARRR